MLAPNLIGFEKIPQTIPHFSLESFRKNHKKDALSFKSGNDWVHISGAEAIERVKRIALGLLSLGVRKGDRVAIISENRPEWSLTDLAILSLKAVNVPIYTTQAVEQIRYILENSGARVLFVSGKKIFKHAQAALEGVEQLEKIVFFDDEAVPSAEEKYLTFSALEKRGEELHKIDEKTFDRLLNELDAQDLATIIYTSGTTGEPKGVMLTHESFTSNVLTISSALPIRPSDIALSVLPLSHIFERVVFYVFCWNGVSVAYAPSFDVVGEYLR